MENIYIYIKKKKKKKKKKNPTKPAILNKAPKNDKRDTLIHQTTKL